MHLQRPERAPWGGTGVRLPASPEAPTTHSQRGLGLRGEQGEPSAPRPPGTLGFRAPHQTAAGRELRGPRGHRRVFLPSVPSLGTPDFSAKLNSRILIPIQPGRVRLKKWASDEGNVPILHSTPHVKGEDEGKAGARACAGEGDADPTVAPAAGGGVSSWSLCAPAGPSGVGVDGELPWPPPARTALPQTESGPGPSQAERRGLGAFSLALP